MDNTLNVLNQLSDNLEIENGFFEDKEVLGNT